MNDLTLTERQKGLIRNLINVQKTEIVWDINAFYFNTKQASFKLECFDASPVGSIDKYDEIFYCEFSELDARLKFEHNKPDFWYKIISDDCKILEVKYVNVIELFPDNKLVPLGDAINNNAGLNKSTLGLILHTDKGFVPAFLLPSNHGFTWHPKIDFYSKHEIDQLLVKNIAYYELAGVTKEKFDDE